jgi:hypothetical protein
MADREGLIPNVHFQPNPDVYIDVEAVRQRPLSGDANMAVHQVTAIGPLGLA